MTTIPPQHGGDGSGAQRHAAKATSAGALSKREAPSGGSSIGALGHDVSPTLVAHIVKQVGVPDACEWVAHTAAQSTCGHGGVQLDAVGARPDGGAELVAYFPRGICRLDVDVQAEGSTKDHSQYFTVCYGIAAAKTSQGMIEAAQAALAAMMRCAPAGCVVTKRAAWAHPTVDATARDRRWRACDVVAQETMEMQVACVVELADKCEVAGVAGAGDLLSHGVCALEEVHDWAHDPVYRVFLAETQIVDVLMKVVPLAQKWVERVVGPDPASHSGKRLRGSAPHGTSEHEWMIASLSMSALAELVTTFRSATERVRSVTTVQRLVKLGSACLRGGGLYRHQARQAIRVLTELCKDRATTLQAKECDAQKLWDHMDGDLGLSVGRSMMLSSAADDKVAPPKDLSVLRMLQRALQETMLSHLAPPLARFGQSTYTVKFTARDFVQARGVVVQWLTRELIDFDRRGHSFACYAHTDNAHLHFRVSMHDPDADPSAGLDLGLAGITLDATMSSMFSMSEPISPFIGRNSDETRAGAGAGVGAGAGAGTDAPGDVTAVMVKAAEVPTDGDESDGGSILSESSDDEFASASAPRMVGAANPSSTPIAPPAPPAPPAALPPVNVTMEIQPLAGDKAAFITFIRSCVQSFVRGCPSAEPSRALVPDPASTGPFPFLGDLPPPVGGMPSLSDEARARELENMHRVMAVDVKLNAESVMLGLKIADNLSYAPDGARALSEDTTFLDSCTRLLNPNAELELPTVPASSRGTRVVFSRLRSGAPRPSLGSTGRLAPSVSARPPSIADVDEETEAPPVSRRQKGAAMGRGVGTLAGVHKMHPARGASHPFKTADPLVAVAGEGDHHHGARPSGHVISSIAVPPSLGVSRSFPGNDGYNPLAEPHVAGGTPRAIVRHRSSPSLELSRASAPRAPLRKRKRVEPYFACASVGTLLTRIFKSEHVDTATLTRTVTSKLMSALVGAVKLNEGAVAAQCRREALAALAAAQERGLVARMGSVKGEVLAACRHAVTQYPDDTRMRSHVCDIRNSLRTAVELVEEGPGEPLLHHVTMEARNLAACGGQVSIALRNNEEVHCECELDERRWLWNCFARPSDSSVGVVFRVAIEAYGESRPNLFRVGMRCLWGSPADFDTISATLFKYVHPDAEYAPPRLSRNVARPSGAAPESEVAEAAAIARCAELLNRSLHAGEVDAVALGVKQAIELSHTGRLGSIDDLRQNRDLVVGLRHVATLESHKLMSVGDRMCMRLARNAALDVEQHLGIVYAQ